MALALQPWRVAAWFQSASARLLFDPFGRLHTSCSPQIHTQDCHPLCNPVTPNAMTNEEVFPSQPLRWGKHLAIIDKWRRKVSKSFQKSYSWNSAFQFLRFVVYLLAIDGTVYGRTCTLYFCCPLLVFVIIHCLFFFAFVFFLKAQFFCHLSWVLNICLHHS